MPQPLMERLARGPLIADGAMGTLLFSRGIGFDQCFDALNRTKPQLIESIHREYLLAGAELIETNTFNANRIILARHGLADQAATINRAAVALAREAAGDRAFVAGAVGPSGVKHGIASASERRLARFALAEQIDTLVLAGVDAIVIETFTSILEMEMAIDVAKELTFTARVLTGEEAAEQWQQVFARAQQAGLLLEQIRGVTSDGAKGLARYLATTLTGVSHQRCVFHLWRTLTSELTARLNEMKAPT